MMKQNCTINPSLLYQNIFYSKNGTLYQQILLTNFISN